MGTISVAIRPWCRPGKIPSSIITKFFLVAIVFTAQVMSFKISGLRPRLSPDAHAYSPCDKNFPALISRWREYEAPTVAGVVEVATESDIQQAVRILQTAAILPV